MLNPSVIYLRASADYEAVGTKPYTTCSVPVTSIRHSTDLRYKSFIWWRLALLDLPVVADDRFAVVAADESIAHVYP